MKLRYWVMLWSAILAFCLATAFSTKASFTSLAFDQQAVLDSYYQYGDDSGIAAVNYSQLCEGSQLIAVCRFTGTRKLQNQCCLSDIQVSSVIKGDPSLKGRSIRVYEPVYPVTRDADGLKIFNDYSQMVTKFNWQGKSTVVITNVYGGENQGNYTLMQKEKPYLLFLNPKQYRSELEHKDSNQYVLLDSPYAKLSVSKDNESSYKMPGNLITLKDSLQYDILLRNPASAKTYYTTRNSILRQLKLI